MFKLNSTPSDEANSFMKTYRYVIYFRYFCHTFSSCTYKVKLET